VYFVRHGESEWNATGRHQDRTPGLSEAGKKQAEFLGQRFIKIPIEMIVSSPFSRARQTAEIVGKKVGVPVEFSELFVECKRPSAVEGKLKSDPEVIEIKTLIKANFHLPNWRHSDEEIYEELKTRAIRALVLIEQFGKERILVVTHGTFLRTVLGLLLLGEEMTAQEWLKIDKFFELSNTGITICDKREDSTWKLVTWNDHAHLG